MFNNSLKIIVILTLLFFSFSTLTAGNIIAGNGNNDNLKIGKNLFEKKEYKKAIEFLVHFIKENGNNWSKDVEVAKAYYILANIYFKNNKTDKRIRILIYNILRLNRAHKALGSDDEFNKLFIKIKQKELQTVLKKKLL